MTAFVRSHDSLFRSHDQVYFKISQVAMSGLKVNRLDLYGEVMKWEHLTRLPVRQLAFLSSGLASSPGLPRPKIAALDLGLGMRPPVDHITHPPYWIPCYSFPGCCLAEQKY